MIKNIIISRLLDKYENSKHLFKPGSSTRRVMLKIGPDKKELPGYSYQDASIRDAYNDAARYLEAEGLVRIEWVQNRPVLSCISLNLERVMDCYRLIDRIHPKERALRIASLIEENLPNVSINWILAWKNDVCTDALQEYKIPSYCKGDFSSISDLLKALSTYDALHGETITMRAFSSRCYQDTKYFERNVRELFLRIAQKYNDTFSRLCDQEELGVREQLAYLGIYARPELYELAGAATIYTKTGRIDLHAAGPYGIAMPSTAIDSITSIDLSGAKKVTFIENKTNYDEYILSEMQSDELAVYHGGFLSPQKKKLFKIIGIAIHEACSISFWADIDLGGFQMYEQLKKIVSNVRPMRMTAQDVTAHYRQGLVRSADYLDCLRNSPFSQEESPFKDTVKQILEYGVTIEQETFLLY